jgi:hypothetical protein
LTGERLFDFKWYLVTFTSAQGHAHQNFTNTLKFIRKFDGELNEEWKIRNAADRSRRVWAVKRIFISA